jgi:hypothetical protein
MKKSCLIACALILCASTAGADVITDWNTTAAQRIGLGARRGPSGLFDFAMVHLAMHDAVQAYEGRFESYCGSIQNATGSPIAAAAAAAHGVLIALFPAQATAINDALDASLAKYGVTGDAGIVTGQQAAACMLGRLAADNAKRALPDYFMGGTAPGEWQPTSSTPAGAPLPMVAGFITTFTPFTLKDPAQFRASQGPPHLTSGAYAKAYKEVLELGAKVGSKRTQEQTNLAMFFSDGPPAYWFGALRSLSATHALSLGDSARLLALAAVSMADAVITAWDSKEAWNFWRPVTAIRLGHSDGNPNTVGNPVWESFAGNPNYPDYTSGANNLSGAAATTILNFFGTDDVEFTLTSATIAAPDNVRHYTRCSDAERDVVDARIYMGIHFRFADTVARRQGARVANWAFGHFLRPIGE